MAAEQTVDLTEKKVVVVPSKTVPQGVSAMLVFDPDASAEDNLSAMTDAMAGVTTMQITYAARDSDIDGHNIHAGEYLALLLELGLCDGCKHHVHAAERDGIAVVYGSHLDRLAVERDCAA